MAVTQRELALQMLAQLRVLDPSVSAEVGTPERKIIDTVAQALTDAQVDLTQLSGALDVDSKYGANLDNFLALFGFGRQQASYATGFVEFSRAVASTVNITIPAGAQLESTQITADDFFEGNITPYFETTFAVTLPAGKVKVVAPVRALTPGVAGNVGAGVMGFVGSPVYGITTIENPAPITGGMDVESDDSLKVRFKNTIFRNLAGTQDQYMAMAASAAYTTKVNVVGPISRYREYIHVPPVDDSEAYSVDDDASLEPGMGIDNEYTTALSTIPYSQHTYTNVPNFVSNGKTGTQTVFYREDIDWRLNTTAEAKNNGDAYRFFNSQDELEGDDPEETPNRPNVTFLNVYTGDDDRVTAPRPNTVLLFEHSYMSTASRNDYDRNVMNAVDVFIDGSNHTVASTVVPSPGNSNTTAFVTGTTPEITNSKYFKDNYRRHGEPDTAPSAGHIFIPLFWQPVVGLPSEIIVADEDAAAIYYLDEHYWLVEDITELHGTVRARNGIEWNAAEPGALSSSDGTFQNRTGRPLNLFASNLSIEINNYVFDKNIVDLQASLEASKQVTTDVLVHRDRTRYFKLDITVMYAAGANNLFVNESIYDAVGRFFKSQYFGNVIQLSDLLQVIHSVSGVDNVRWSSDVPGSEDEARVTETNIKGEPRPDEVTPSDPRTFSNDFFLKDDELPSLPDTISNIDQAAADARAFAVQPGLIIRSRAQNTWIRS